MAEMLGGEIVVYEASDGAVQVSVRLEQETVWLSLTQIADLFGRDKSVISRHLRNIFASGELEREATVAKYATVQQEGDREVVREIEYFNLDAILSVGYRVNSKRGTQFRIGQRARCVNICWPASRSTSVAWPSAAWARRKVKSARPCATWPAPAWTS